ncbi:MAG: hypothetical protein U1F43_27500 [Myxococcota bacterium]
MQSNPNGSINSSCRLDCASDADCSAVLGDGYTCATPGAGTLRLHTKAT